MKCEFLETINGIDFVITKSEYMLLQNETGVKYANPNDIGEYDSTNNEWKPKYYTYTETDELIPVEQEEEEQIETEEEL